MKKLALFALMLLSLGLTIGCKPAEKKPAAAPEGAPAAAPAETTPAEAPK